MKTGDTCWVECQGQVCEVAFVAHKNAGDLYVRLSDGFSLYRHPSWTFDTEREAVEALIEHQTQEYAEQTEQHNDLIARLSKRLEDL